MTKLRQCNIRRRKQTSDSQRTLYDDFSSLFEEEDVRGLDPVLDPDQVGIRVGSGSEQVWIRGGPEIRLGL